MTAWQSNIQRGGKSGQSKQNRSIPFNAHVSNCPAKPAGFSHTFGADMVRAGISLPALQHLMGHSQIRTAMLYVQLAPQDIWREYASAIGKRTRLGSSQIV